jgi:serine-type D-Ala-D-Ala carboxypeptidase/endopeptidase (penicillin-binding protein 4)
MSKNSKLKNHLTVLIAIFLLMPLASCHLFQRSDRTNSNQTSNENSFEVPKPNIDLEKPLVISEAPEDIELCRQINQTLDQSEFSKARWGIIAVSLRDGRVLCGRDGQKLFTPASVQKILTSVVALDRLGADFRWKTSLYAEAEIKDGVLAGDLVLYGRGAPDFDDEQLGKLVTQFKQKGVREITGDIIGDESYFTGDNYGDGWTWNELQWYYGAASSALSINRNQISVIIKDGKPEADSDFVELSGEVKPIEDIEAVGIKRELGTNKVYVWGNGKNLNARIAINQPALFSARILKEVLEKNGIKVGGRARAADWKSTDKLDPNAASEIASVESRTLGETVHKMNKDSVNLYAELILRTLGKKFGEEAPDENPKMQKLRGDDAAGASVVRKWLADKNVATEEIAIHDGSGLSRLNNITPEAVGRTLVYAAQSEFADVFKNSLPVAGRSGTLKGRLGGVSGKILGKTGSIRYVNTLAGYAQTKDETLVFAILGNNITKSENSSEVIDRAAANLVGEF